MLCSSNTTKGTDMCGPKSYIQLAMEFEDWEDSARSKAIAKLREKLAIIMSWYDQELDFDDNLHDIDMGGYDAEDALKALLLIEEIKELTR